MGTHRLIDNVLSVDVEDWFHILDLPEAPNLAGWEDLPSRVEKNFLGLLDIFDEGDAKATCFFLGGAFRCGTKGCSLRARNF